MFFKDSPVKGVRRRIVDAAYIVKKVSAVRCGRISPAKIGVGVHVEPPYAAAHVFPCRRIFYEAQSAYNRQPLAVVRIRVHYAIFKAA